MRRFAVAALWLASMSALAADKIPAGSKIFIEPMDGFDAPLSAAILKKHVPVTIVDAKDKAEYVLSGTASTEKAGWAKTIFVSPAGSARASVQLKSADGTLVWAYSVDKMNASKGEQSTAEAVAKHMKGEAVESGKK